MPGILVNLLHRRPFHHFAGVHHTHTSRYPGYDAQVMGDVHYGRVKIPTQLSNQVQHVNSMQIDANDMVHSMLTGGDVNEAEALTAVQKADLAFRMLLQVRNKLIEAYREVQQIQI